MSMRIGSRMVIVGGAVVGLVVAVLLLREGKPTPVPGADTNQQTVARHLEDVKAGPSKPTPTALPESPAKGETETVVPRSGASSAIPAVPLTTLAKPGVPITAEERFTLAKRYMELFSGDAVGGSREGHQAAAHDIEVAMRDGYPNRVEGYKLLASVYHELALGRYARPDTSDRREYRAKEAGAYRQLMKLEPSNSLWSYEFAMAHEDKGALLAALLETVKKFPRLAKPRYVAGQLQMERGEVEAGAKNLVEATRCFSPDEARELGADVLYWLKRYGSGEDVRAAEAALAKAMKGSKSRGTEEDQ